MLHLKKNGLKSPKLHFTICNAGLETSTVVNSRIWFSSALSVTRRPKQTLGSSTGDATRKSSFPANRLTRSDNFKRMHLVRFFNSEPFSHSLIRMWVLWVMNESVCFSPAVLHYRAIVCVIRARAQPKLKPCQVAVMRRRVQVQRVCVCDVGECASGPSVVLYSKPRLIFPPPSRAIYITHVFYCTAPFFLIHYHSPVVIYPNKWKLPCLFWECNRYFPGTGPTVKMEDLTSPNSLGRFYETV